MWDQNANSSFGGGGGFVTSLGKTPSQDKKDNARRAQNIVPATIKQIMDSDGDGYKIEDIEAHIITIVGLIRSVEQTTTKISYQIDDGTGLMEGVVYVGSDGDASTTATAVPQVIMLEGTYGRVVGALRKNKDTKYITIFKSMPITDMNEVTCHMMEVAMLPKKLKKMLDEEEAATGFGGGGMLEGALPNSMIASTSIFSTTSRSGMSPCQEACSRILQGAPTENQEGVNKDYIYEQVKGRFTSVQVNDALDFLVQEGHAYTTVDENHFKGIEN